MHRACRKCCTASLTPWQAVGAALGAASHEAAATTRPVAAPARAQAQKNAVGDALKKANLNLAAALLDIANVSGPAAAKNAKWTALM